MKTIEEIINRDDYVRLNNALFNRAISIAIKIRTKMNDLDIIKLSVEGCSVSICQRKSNVGTCEFLGMIADSDDRDFCDYYNSLEHSHSEYYAGDFSCWIEKATYAQRLRLLNNARALFDELDRIETDKCNAINAAIEQTNDLVK